MRSRVAEDRVEKEPVARGRGENAKDEEEDATQKPIASLYEERKGGGMTGSPRCFEGSRVRRESDERKSIGTAIFKSGGTRERRESEGYDSAFFRGRRRGRWCRSGCVEQKNKEVVMVMVNRRAETTERGSWRKDGKRRKQKAIAYERQLAPLMARETKQKSEASSSNTIKPTVPRLSLARLEKRKRRKDEKEEK